MSLKTAMAAADERRTAGPFAFPTAYNGGEHEGMTLRDYFAAKAMQGVIGNLFTQMPGGASSAAARAIAQLCYDVADAMIEERKHQ